MKRGFIVWQSMANDEPIDFFIRSPYFQDASHFWRQSRRARPESAARFFKMLENSLVALASSASCLADIENFAVAWVTKCVYV